MGNSELLGSFFAPLAVRAIEEEPELKSPLAPTAAQDKMSSLKEEEKTRELQK